VESTVFISTLTDEADVQPLALTVTVYVPLIDVVAFVLVGFCCVLVYPPGPVHEYVTAAAVVLEVKFKVAPVHNGLLLPAVGIAGALRLASVNGPTTFDTQLLRATVMLE
jgi:hypothetical protein